MKRFKLIAVVLFIPFIICLIVYSNGGKKMNAKSKLVFFELGSKGNSTLVETIDDKGNPIYGIIDGGKPINYTKQIEPYLTENKISKIHFIIVSHMHDDHVGGIDKLLQSDFVNNETTIYLKLTPKSEHLTNYAKLKEMNIGVIEPLSVPDNIKTNNEVMSSPDSIFQTQIKYYSKADGDYANANMSSNISFGEFTITIYNGINWNTHDVVNEDWDENVNSLTCLLERKNSKDDMQRVYLSADLGENSGENSTDGRKQYSMVIGERISQIVGQVDIYQVAHHGFYFSMNEETARNLNFKYAVVTNSYNEIAYKGIAKFQKKYPSISETEALDIGTNTLKALFSSEHLVKILFADGENYGTGPTAYELIKELQPSNRYVLTRKDGYIKNGNITVELESDITVSQ
ncbi:MBL fold metallo-hydrolase [Anaerocolumna aminovalerica]|uniref:MBL fold metallo-hydrolase n=1 Tax=Anaerocolumna aminovalerica TaxID=1527 RepID=UPI00248C1656|nr:MBL fold metallo-hydrolase [Anaerocolumna aminovalerica]